MRTFYLAIAAMMASIFGLSVSAPTADAQYYGGMSRRPPPHYRPMPPRPRPMPAPRRNRGPVIGAAITGAVIGAMLQSGRHGHHGHPHGYYQSYGDQHGGYIYRKRIVKRMHSGPAYGPAVASRPLPPPQPQVPPANVRSSPGAIPVHGAQGIRYTGGPGSCTRSDGSPGRAGLSPLNEPVCYRF